MLLISYIGTAQQDPQYTQYMYNMSVINPAYTTNNLGVINFGALYRSQWQNLSGAPETATFFMHAPINERIETGLSLVSDNIGDGALKETNFYADFAYILPLTEKNKLSLGIKAGFTDFSVNLAGYRLPETQDDDAFPTSVNELFPNVGVGAFFTGENYYAGISTPNLLSSQHLESENGLNTGSEDLHFFLTGGYIYDVNGSLKLKPSFLAKAVTGAPISLDMSLNAQLYNKFEIGASYRLEDAVSAMFNVLVTPSIRVGYAYDYTLSNIGNFDAGSHEILVLFDLDLLGLSNGHDKSPRFY